MVTRSVPRANPDQYPLVPSGITVRTGLQHNPDLCGTFLSHCRNGHVLHDLI